MTIADSVANEFYPDPRSLGQALAEALNAEVRDLAAAGCRNIQVDEPVFARKPRQTLEYGIEHLERVFHGVPDGVQRIVHMCCGYPSALDVTDYPKADPQAYFRIAGAMDDASIDAVSIEDAHRHNDLSLLERYTRTTVLLGVVDVGRSRVEPVDEIAQRLGQAIEHIDPRRLVAASGLRARPARPGPRGQEALEPVRGRPRRRIRLRNTARPPMRCPKGPETGSAGAPRRIGGTRPNRHRRHGPDRLAGRQRLPLLATCRLRAAHAQRHQRRFTFLMRV